MAATHGLDRTEGENFIAALHARLILIRVYWLEGGHEILPVPSAPPILMADVADGLESAAAQQ